MAATRVLVFQEGWTRDHGNPIGGIYGYYSYERSGNNVIHQFIVEFTRLEGFSSGDFPESLAYSFTHPQGVTREGSISRPADGQTNTVTTLPVSYAHINAAQETVTGHYRFYSYNYDQWIEADFSMIVPAGGEYVLSFNPGGGSVSPTSKSVTAGSAAGTLPTPTPPVGYGFLGWYTAASGGSQITASTVPTGDMTVYAHYKPLAILRLAQSGAVSTVTDIRVVVSGTPKQVLSVWSVSGGVVKQGV